MCAALQTVGKSNMNLDDIEESVALQLNELMYK